MLGRCLVLVSSATTCCCSFLPECYWQRGGYEGISLLKCSHDWGSKVHWEHTRKNRKKRDWYWKTFCLKAYSLKKKSGNRLIKELTCFKNLTKHTLDGTQRRTPPSTFTSEMLWVKAAFRFLQSHTCTVQINSSKCPFKHCAHQLIHTVILAITIRIQEEWSRISTCRKHQALSGSFWCFSAHSKKQTRQLYCVVWGSQPECF